MGGDSELVDFGEGDRIIPIKINTVQLSVGVKHSGDNRTIKPEYYTRMLHPSSVPRSQKYPYTNSP